MTDKDQPQTFEENQAVRGEEASQIRKIVFIVLSVIVLILVLGGLYTYNYVTKALEPVDESSEEDIAFDIPIGSSTTNIAEILEENGLIKDSRIFRIYAKLNNESDFQAGSYTFTPSMTFDEIIDSLKTGKVEITPEYRITIPEGLTIEEIANIYAQHFSFSNEEFVEKANDREYVAELIEAYPLLLTNEILDENIQYPLEGYLYAITYDFYEVNPTIEEIIEIMLAHTQSVVNQYQAELERLDLSIHEYLTFASLVEKETGHNEQREDIAAVFYNRLEANMRLQTDPTVLYALGEHKDRVLYKDLEVDSPYNTYRNEGLPVGPISNFGEKSLNAVVNPVESDYYYFLHDKEGNIYYAETLDEHNANIANYMN